MVIDDEACKWVILPDIMHMAFGFSHYVFRLDILQYSVVVASMYIQSTSYASSMTYCR